LEALIFWSAASGFNRGGLPSSIPEDSLPSEISVALISPGRSVFIRGAANSTGACPTCPMKSLLALFHRGEIFLVLISSGLNVKPV
jgi:hypothetical protein